MLAAAAVAARIGAKMMTRDVASTMQPSAMSMTDRISMSAKGLPPDRSVKRELTIPGASKRARKNENGPAAAIIKPNVPVAVAVPFAELKNTDKGKRLVAKP